MKPQYLIVVYWKSWQAAIDGNMSRLQIQGDVSLATVSMMNDIKLCLTVCAVEPVGKLLITCRGVLCAPVPVSRCLLVLIGI